jgi:hypothetical protein
VLTRRYAKAYFIFPSSWSNIITSLSRKVFKKGGVDKWTYSSKL